MDEALFLFAYCLIINQTRLNPVTEVHVFGWLSKLSSSFPTNVSRTVAFLLDTVFNLFCYMVFWCACNSHWLLISMPSSLSPVLRRMPLLLCRLDNFAELSDHDWNTLSSHEPRTPAHWCIHTFKASRYSSLLLRFCLSGDIFFHIRWQDETVGTHPLRRPIDTRWTAAKSSIEPAIR